MNPLRKLIVRCTAAAASIAMALAMVAVFNNDFSTPAEAAWAGDLPTARPNTDPKSLTPQVLFAEDFGDPDVKQSTFPKPEALIGVGTVYKNRHNGAEYTAAPEWSAGWGGCNGWVVRQGVPDGDFTFTVSPGDNCSKPNEPDIWFGPLAMARALGSMNGGNTGSDDALNNYALTEMSSRPETQPPGVWIKNDSLADGVENHYYSMSGKFATISCGINDRKTSLTLSLITNQQQNQVVSGIRPCDGEKVYVKQPNNKEIPVWRLEAFTPSLKARAGETLGFQVYNNTGSYWQNDSAFDDPTIVDVTPQLDQHFTNSALDKDAVNNGGASTYLTYTITNTTELGDKEGWGFTADLNDLLTTTGGTTGTVINTCGGTASVVDGVLTLDQGQLTNKKESCEVKVPLTVTKVPTGDVYTLSKGTVTALDGLWAPDDAELGFASLSLDLDSASERVTKDNPQASYTFTVTNTGGTELSDVTVGVFGPDGNAASGIDTSSVNVTCNPTVLAPTDEATCQMAFAVTDFTTPRNFAFVASGKAGNGSVSVTSKDGVTDTLATTMPPVTITSPATGAATNDNTPTFVGTGEPGATVTVTGPDGTPVCVSGVIGTDGKWSCTPVAEIPDGENATFTATQKDPEGNESEGTDVTITIDTQKPGLVTITSPEDGDATKDSTPTFVGTGEPGATVTVTGPDRTPVCVSGVIGTDGKWECTPGNPLTDGVDVTFTATQKDLAGNVSEGVDVSITIDTQKPGPVTITSPEDGDATNDNTPTFVGTGEPGATVTVTRPGVDPAHPVTVCTAVVNKDGDWNCTAEDSISDAEDLVFTATQEDAAGNVSDPETVTITINTQKPGPVTITSPETGDATNDNTPTFVGTGEPGATVTVTRPGVDPAHPVTVCTAVVDKDGDWNCTAEDPIGDAEDLVFTATQEDAAGNVSDPETVTITIDTQKPGPVTITSPETGDATNDNTPTFVGTGEPGATVTVTGPGGTPVCTAEVNKDGDWNCTAEDSISDAEDLVFTATQEDAAGNVSDPETVTITIDTQKPGPVTITSPATGAATNDNTPTFVGTGEPGATVTVTGPDGTPVCVSNTIGTDGKWECTPTSVIPDGVDVTFTATQTDPAGNVSDGVDVTVTIDTQKPGLVTITSPATGAATNDNTPTFTGTGEPGATVTVTMPGVDAAHPVVVCTTVVNKDGDWNCTAEDPITDGTVTFTATQEDAAGNVSPGLGVTITIDTVKPGQPVITTPTSGDVTKDRPLTVMGTGEPGSTVTVKDKGTSVVCTPAPVTVTEDEDGNGVWSCQVDLNDGDHELTATQTDKAGNVSDPSAKVGIIVDTLKPGGLAITTPSNGDVTNDNTPTFTGKGEPGATVTVTMPGVDAEHPVAVCTTVVKGAGNWECTAMQEIGDATVTFTATQEDAAGNVSDPETVTVTIDTKSPEAPEITSPGTGDLTKEQPLVVTGTGEPGSTIEVTDKSGEKVCVATADEDGNWSCEVELPDGENELTATSTDKAGNKSEPSGPIMITVDVTSPGAPRIDHVDETQVSGGEGSAEPGSIITVTFPNGTTATTVAKEDGSWSVPTPEGMIHGTFTVTATDEAGNTSEKSTAVWEIEIQTGGTARSAGLVPAVGIVFLLAGAAVLAWSRRTAVTTK